MSDPFPRDANPYRPGAGSNPPELAGRDDLIRAFTTVLSHAKAGRPSKSMMPIGLRGVGKTVLLNRFSREAENVGYKVGYIEAPETGEMPALIASRVRRVLLDYEREGVRGISAALARALRVFKSFTIGIEADGRPSFSLDIEPERGRADSGDLDEDLTDLLVAVGEAALDRSSGVLIAIDELQNLSERELAAIIMAVHRTTQLDLPIVVAGTGLPSLPGLAGKAKSYAERLFDFPKIGSLPEPAALLAITAPAERHGVRFEDAALAQILDVTGAYPYFLQEWAYEVWERARRSPITAADVEAVRDIVSEKLDRSFFRVRFDRVSPAERRYLRAMAELGPGPHRSGEIAGAYGVSVTRVASVRDSLINKGMIYSSEYGRTEFTVPLFDEFLRREVAELQENDA